MKCIFEAIKVHRGWRPLTFARTGCKDQSEDFARMESARVAGSGGSKAEAKDPKQFNRRVRGMGTAMEMPQSV